MGNSQGVKIPLKILKNSQIDIGEEIEIVVEGGKIILTPTYKIHGKYCIKDLVAEMPEDYQVQEIDWHEKKGKEEW